MIQMKLLASREDWLKERGLRIGGSDAACLIGLNPWKSNVDLFREKTGEKPQDDLSGNEAVRYGSEAEEHIREIFRLNHPELDLQYEPGNLWINDDCPFAHASLDGWLMGREKVDGILEIKTATIRSDLQKNRDWYGRIPDHYYCQVQWYMMVTGASFTWLYALLRMPYTRGACDELSDLRGYYIPRDGEAIEMLAEAGSAFYEAIKLGEEPALILPEI